MTQFESGCIGRLGFVVIITTFSLLTACGGGQQSPSPTPGGGGTPTSSGSTTDCSGIAVGQGASLNGFRPFPDTNPWNLDVSGAAVDANSASIISYIGSTAGLHADFGSGTFGGSTIGIPYIVVDSTQPKVNVAVNIYASE